MECHESCLTLNLLNASKWQMGFNSAFKGLRNHKYNGPSVTWITSVPDNFGPNIAGYSPVTLLLQYIIIVHY